MAKKIFIGHANNRYFMFGVRDAFVGGGVFANGTHQLENEGCHDRAGTEQNRGVDEDGFLLQQFQD